ncbi:hypothetical protein [Halobaculum sp. D14]|uniref:hypothetical protein n=1 Tax=unclassified Halobaculum TaxID=2640896 RepID=UPI003EBA0D40
MRRVTRSFLLLLAAVVVLLLALGAVPSYLGSGDPYYLTAEPAADGPALNVTDFSERRYPYLFEALESDDGRSSAYRSALGGRKDWFANSPFDEVGSLRSFAPANATAGDAVFVRYEGERYRVEVVQP